MATPVPLAHLQDNPWQTRTEYDETHIADLATDIHRNGLLQSPVGRIVDADGKLLRAPGDFYNSPSAILISGGAGDSISLLFKDHEGACIQLAFGHNRKRAYARLHVDDGLTLVERTRFSALPVEIRALSDEEMANAAWSENAARSDLSPIEEALAIQRRMKDFGYTQSQVAEKLSLARSSVANKLRLLALPVEVREALHVGTVSVRAAQAILPLVGREEPLRSALLAVKDAWTDETAYEELIKKTLSGVSSERLRTDVQGLLRRSTKALGIVDPAHNYGPSASAQAMRQGTCKGCPLLITIGEDKHCGDKACWGEKRDRAAGLLLKAASEETGLSITNSYDERKTSPFYGYGSGEKLAQRLLRKGCPASRLHLRLNEGYGGYRLENHPHTELVCLHGTKSHCTCQHGKSGSSSHKAEQAAAAQETRIGRAQARLLGEERYAAPAKAVVFEALKAKNTKVWNVALEIVRSGPNSSWAWSNGPHEGFFSGKESALISPDRSHEIYQKAGDSPPEDFEALCRLLADWVLDIDRHHHEYPDKLNLVKQFAQRRLKAMGLRAEEPDYGAVNVNLLVKLATLPVGEIEPLLQKANADTLLDLQRRLTDQRGHKARLKLVEERLAELSEPI